MLTKVLQGSLEGSLQVHLAVSLRASQAAYRQCLATLQWAAGCDAANDADNEAQVWPPSNPVHVKLQVQKKHAGHCRAWLFMSKPRCGVPPCGQSIGRVARRA